MKILKVRDVLKVVFCLLCFIIAFSCSSCGETDRPDNSESQKATEQNTEQREEYADVVVFKNDVAEGTILSPENLEVIRLPKENLPSNVINNVDDVTGLYANKNFYAGDYVVKTCLLEFAPALFAKEDVQKSVESSNNEFVVVTDFVKSSTGEDIYEELQAIIDTNPGRTLYFPDGEYVISQSLETSGNPDKSTSFCFSSGAALRAAENWKNNGIKRALICLGARERSNDINTPGSNFYVMGGTFIANGKCDGISVIYGRETLIKDVVVLNARYGIHVMDNTSIGVVSVDIDNVTVVGSGLEKSTGIYMMGFDHTVTNARISNVQVGIRMSAGNAVSNCVIENTAKLEDAIGVDTSVSEGWVTNCTVRDFPTAYLLSKGRSVLRNCTATWTFDLGDERVAFEVGKLRALIIGCKAEFANKNVDNYFIKATEEGKQTIVCPMFDRSLLCDGDLTEKHLAPTSKMPT